jgi:hypothetical protein
VNTLQDESWSLLGERKKSGQGTKKLPNSDAILQVKLLPHSVDSLPLFTAASMHDYGAISSAQDFALPTSILWNPVMILLYTPSVAL